ncbi:damage-control phosphatase ARMT1 family protein [Clostridium oceanicum]|uniref:DUF89 domain-containing protein n=1 Tax=Clostridium oceanicum TaxID=1543 RepID=A0ABP3URI0_9CLOT
MDINLQCANCIIKKADSMYSKCGKDEDKKLQFMKKVWKMVGESKEGDSAPYISTKIQRILNDEFNLGDTYYDIKKEYNNLLISMEDEILKNIYNSEDRLVAALKYAMVGNFIDFGAMDKVDKDKLKETINSASKQEVNPNEYSKFKEELKGAKNLVYIMDNSGEIVFDKLFIKVIKEKYPNVNIDVIVRGKPVYNDATMVDAEEIGLSKIVNVLHNGSDIPGTQLNEINKESKEIIDNADLMISKGQGNFETLFGCGENIYYIFLCKCDLFTGRFNLEKFKGVFVNEKRVKDIMK